MNTFSHSTYYFLTENTQVKQEQKILRALSSKSQNKQKKKAFYLHKQILEIDTDKIYVKDGLNLNLISRLNGVCLRTLSLSFEIYHFYIDSNNSRFITINKKNNAPLK